MEGVSGVKLNAGGICVRSSYEELLRDDKFASHSFSSQLFDKCVCSFGYKLG